MSNIPKEIEEKAMELYPDTTHNNKHRRAAFVAGYSLSQSAIQELQKKLKDSAHRYIATTEKLNQQDAAIQEPGR